MASHADLCGFHLTFDLLFVQHSYRVHVTRSISPDHLNMEYDRRH